MVQPKQMHRWALQHYPSIMDQISKRSKTFSLSVIAILSSSKFSPRITRENKMPNPAVEQPGYLVITETKVKCYMEMHKRRKQANKENPPPISITEIPVDLFCFGYSLLTVLKHFYRCSFT